MATLISLIGVITVFELGVNTGWSTILKIASIAFLALLFISYPLCFIRTGLWHFTHRRIDDLDEREMQLTGKSLRIAYSVFSIIVLVVLYVFALLEIKVSVVLAAGLLLFAHVLPGTVIAFLEKNLHL
jgi:hypothetical protein